MVRKILVVTVGEQKTPLFEGFKRVKDIDKVYLLASKFSEKYANDIQDGISKIHSSEIVIINEKNFQETISKIIGLHQKERNSEFVYNITGGTKIMSVACHVVASFLGEEVFYIFKAKDEMEFVNVPILRYNITKIVKKYDRKHDILKLMVEQNTTSLTKLSDELKLKKPTVLGHLNKLIEHNLISINPNNKKYFITDTGKIFLDILEVV